MENRKSTLSEIAAELIAVKELAIGLIGVKTSIMSVGFSPLTDCIVYLMDLDEKYWKEIDLMTDAGQTRTDGKCEYNDTPPKEIYQQLLKYKK